MNEQRIKKEEISSHHSSHQIYGIATYDALFKYILSQDQIRPSFFQAFIPGLTIKSSQRLDDHMNPFQELQLLRDFIHRKDTTHTVKRLTSSSDMCVGTLNSGNSLFVKDSEATVFIHEMVGHFDDIQRAFPQVKYDGTMDFVCELDNGEYAMVEMQVLPEDSWDRRALAYVASFYGNQLRKGGHWDRIRKVIGINILGGGKEDKRHWKETPDQYIRHYKFQEQLQGQSHEKRYIDGMELIQYSIMNAPPCLEDQGREDWITFFKRGHRMNEEEVKREITTPEVLRAFELAKLTKLPKEVKAIYDEEDHDYQRYSQHTQDLVNEGKAEGEEIGEKRGLEKGKAEEKQQNIRNLLSVGVDKNIIAQALNVSIEEVEGIKI